LRLPTTDRLVLVMSALDILASLFFAFGELPHEVSEGFCDFQGFGVQTFGLATVFWNSCMAHNLYSWVVAKKDLASLGSNMRYYLAISMGVPTAFAVGLLAGGQFGWSSIWCWIESSSNGLRFACFYLFVVLAWLYNGVVFVAVTLSIRSRLADRRSPASSAIATAQNNVRRKMTQYIFVFFFVWFFGLLNRTVQDLVSGTVFWPMLLHVTFVPLQGFLNAVVYGGLLETTAVQEFVRRAAENGAVGWMFKPCARGMPQEEKNLLANGAPIARGVWEKKPKNRKKKISVFISTYNLAEKTLDELGDLSSWIPPGHDLYAIGVQECMCMDPLRSKLLYMLGGPGSYEMYTAEIGSTNTALGFHGMIAVTIYARSSYVESGSFYMPSSNTTEVKKGADLIVTKAPNKGAVGVPFVVCDTSLCFFTGHFAANSKGRNRLAARIADSKDTLAKAVLTSDDIKFDCHLTHHYTFLFGDLNFRCVSNPPNVLSLVSAACKLERDASWGGRPGWRSEAYGRLSPGGRPKVLGARAAGAWAEVAALDELRLVMSHEEIFVGFEEPGGGPEFPPSFRRKMGAEGDCGDYCDKGKLLAAFTTNVKEKKAEEGDKNKGGGGGDAVDGVDAAERGGVRSTGVQDSIKVKLKLGERIPSYTDRVLYHALPDKEQDIEANAYELCDSCCESDHRPVSAQFDIYVDDSIRRGAVGEVDDGNDYRSMEGGSTRYSGTRCTFLLKAFNMRVVGPGEAGDSPPSERNSLRTGELESLVEEVVIVFPLPTEDPLIEERRVHALASAMGGASQVAKNGALFTSKDGVKRVSVVQDDLWQNEKRVAWRNCVDEDSEGVIMISECRPELGVHALLKVNDARGECIGQVVMGFGDYLLQVTSGKPCTVTSTMPMTKGGKKVGELTAVFNLSELFRVDANAAGGDNLV